LGLLLQVSIPHTIPPIIYGYIRVSTDKQTTENQRYEILKYIDEKSLKVNHWLEETVSGTKRLEDRSLGELIPTLKKGDMLICTEVSRLGRNIMEVMGLLKTLMEKQVTVVTIKERYELGDNLNSKVLAFAFSLAAEIEHNMISQRTKEALARKKSEGKKLGRPKGSRAKVTKLTGRNDEIKQLLDKKISISGIARILQVNRMTLSQYIKLHHLQADEVKPPAQKQVKPVEKTIKVKLWLRIERNNKYVRGMKKSRELIESVDLYPYKMKKSASDDWEYILTIPYTTDEELDELIYDLYREMESTANGYNCWTEANISSLDGKRSW
jgi:DNA invertase Pin-like site-specific DNA recombinase